MFVLEKHKPSGYDARVMDELAQRYLGLTLRLERLVPGVLEAYAGPPELREAIATEPAPQARELHDEALAIEDAALAVRALAPAEERRRRWLAAQAGALATAARVVGGEEIALPDLVESLDGIRAEREPEASLLGAHRLLDAALPEGPSLRARLSAHRELTAIQADHLPEAAERLAAVLSRRAHEDLELPADEQLLLEPAHAADATWRARATFEPPHRTRLTLNTSIPWALESLVGVVAGEGYPGRHAMRVTRLHADGDGRHAEACAWTRPSPEAALAAGVAGAGREALLGDFELAAELRRIGHDLGQRWEVERELEVARARGRLAAAVANAALLLHHDGLPASEVRAYLAEMALLEADAVERVMALLDDPLHRVEPFAQASMPALVRDWLATTGQTDGLRRLLVEQLTPGQLRDEAGVPA